MKYTTIFVLILVLTIAAIGVFAIAAFNNVKAPGAAEWTYYGYNTKTMTAEIDGHKYILAAGNGTVIVHAESCRCKNAVR